MRNSLLWVYEGLTEYWGRVIAARAGLRNTQDTLDAFALDAAIAAARVGRTWKSLQDSNNDPLYMAGHPVAWSPGATGSGARTTTRKACCSG